ncbi:MAG TPA: PKD domain-containing protein [Armatimonadota bacterium]|jgi:hypothetical protein
MQYTALLARALAVAVVIAVPAGAVVIDFEDLGTGPTSVQVTNQYASLGVIFSNATDINFDTGQIQIPGFAHSGIRAVEPCFAAEFCNSPMSISFTAGQARVKAWVGLDFSSTQSTTIEMAGYDAGGSKVTSTTVTFPAKTSPTLIRTPMEIGRFAADIWRVDIGVAPVGIGYNNGIGIDDIEFDTIGPPPPCPAVNPPSVGIVQPASGLVTRCNRFLFQDNVITGDPFARRTIMVHGPSMGQLTQWTTPVSSGVSAVTWLYGSLFPGLNTVTDRIEDCKGFAEKSATVEYDPIPDGTRIVVDGFEPTQAVQTVPNTVPLIVDKRTVVRVYLHLEGPLTTLPGLSGSLSAYLPSSFGDFYLGAGIPPYSVQSLNTVTATQSTDLQAARKSINASLNFEVPASWTENPKVHFQLSGIWVDGCDTRLEVDGGNNTLAYGNYLYNTFTPAPPVRVRLFAVPYQTTSGGTVFTPRDLDFNFLESWLRRAYPTAEVISSRSTLSTRTGTPDGSFSADDINSQLQDTRSMEVSSGSVDDRTHYYGMVADGGGFMRGKADDIPGWVASGPTGNRYFGWDTDGTYGDWYGGHELGHTFGRFHAEYCGAQACFTFIWTFCPGGYVPYPFFSGLLASDWTYGNYGFDVGDPGLKLPRAVYRPDVYHDVMTYCDYEWVSDFTYEGIMSRLQAENPSGLRTRRAPIADALMVSAKMNLTQETAQLRPFWRMPNLEPTPRPATSHYSVHLKDIADADLAVYLFSPKVDSEAVAGEDLKASLSEVVPWVSGTHRIVVMRDGVEIASRTVSANTPIVHVLSPNGGENLSGATAVVTWQASDADNQPLTYALQYSKDGGLSWQVVDSGIQTTSYTVNLDEIPGSAKALFRVYATDGVNTGVDSSDAVFTVRTKPPKALIISPGNNNAFTTADTITFTGSASDIEDGSLSGAALQWTSNLQGVLGSGTSISDSLKPGTHVITLTATDSGGASGVASINLVVSAAAPMPEPGPDRYAIVGSNVALDGSASTGVPALTYAWTMVSMPDGSTSVIANPGTASPSFTPDRPGAYVVQLTITDGTGTIAAAQVTIHATDSVSALRIAGGLATSTPADMAAMDVESGGISAGHIDIVDAVRLLKRALLDTGGGGAVTVTIANQLSSVPLVGRGYGVLIDDPRLNGSPDRRVLACHQFIGAYNTHPLAVEYLPAVQKWAAFNEDHHSTISSETAILPLGEKINYAFGPTVGAVTRSSAGGPFPWGVYLDDPRINYSPNAIVLSMHDRISSAGQTLGVWYSGSKWVAINEAGATIPGTERYFWVDAAASGGRIVMSPSTAYSNYGVYLDDARINGNSGAIVLAQHSGSGSYNTSPVAVWYDGARWVAYNDDVTPLETGEAINYYIVTP